jgi:SAM-dependent methyltransferase
VILNNSRNLGYHLNPSISKHLKDGSAVADIAAGTAIWLVEVAQKFPGVQCHGFDISDAQFPPKDRLPSNVVLSVADAKKDFPKEFHGIFDVIQIRFLFAALWTDDDWTLVARNVKTLLKPGGTLQWVEIDPSPAIIPLRSSNGPTSMVAMRRGFGLIKSFPKAYKIRDRFVETRLASLLAECGYQNVEEDMVGTDRLPEYRKEFTLDIIQVMHVATKKFFAANIAGNWPTQEEADNLFTAMKKEAENGGYIRMEIHAFTATA